MYLTLFSIAVFTILSGSIATKNNVICYHGSWSTYRWGNGRFTVDDIDPSLCTHIAYGFVGLNDNGTINILDRYLEVDLGNFKKFTGLKTKNPSLKALLSIGGWNEGSLKYSRLAADAGKRAVFIKSAVNLLQTYGFDGLDIDWEYPAQRGGSPSDKTNYVTLLKECRQAFDDHGLLLTAAVSAAENSVDISYDVPALTKYLDLINVMAYDLHGVWDGVTGENAPLYGSSINVDGAIQGWIRKGADPKKLILGLAAYGRSFTLRNPTDNRIGAPTSGAGNAGKYTSESGMLGYNEIVELQGSGKWTIVWDDEQKTPYMYNGNQWVGYDNEKSISEKVKYAKSLGLGGVMLWSIETEDFRGISGQKYPLLNAIRRILEEQETGNEKLEPTTEPTSSPTKRTERPDSKFESSEEESGEDNTIPPTHSPDEPSPAPSTEDDSDTEPSSDKVTPDAPEEVVDPSDYCKAAGYVRDPKDCSIFYYCLRVGDSWSPLKQQCAGRLVFDVKSGICNYPELVHC